MDALIELGVILIIAGICGAFAQALLGMPRNNFLVSMVIGVVGAYLGSYLAQRYNWPSILVLPIGTSRFEIAWAFVGSLLLVFVLSILNDIRRRSSRRR